MSQLNEINDRNLLFLQKTWAIWFCMGDFNNIKTWILAGYIPISCKPCHLARYCKGTLFVQQKRYLECRVNLHSMTCNTLLSTYLTFWCWFDEDLAGRGAFAGGHYTIYPQGHSQMYCLYKEHVNMNKWFEDICIYK